MGRSPITIIIPVPTQINQQFSIVCVPYEEKDGYIDLDRKLDNKKVFKKKLKVIDDTYSSIIPAIYKCIDEDNNISKNENKDTSEGASGFSDEAEKKYQEKKKGKMEKLHNVVSKGLIPPKPNQPESKGKWNDLKVRVKWSIFMASFFFLILTHQKDNQN